MINNLFILLLYCFNTNFYQQQVSKYDSVEVSSIQIKNQLNKTYSLGFAKQLQIAFGKIKAIKEVDEVSGGYGYTYKYPGLIAEFHEKDFEAIDILNPTFKVFLNGNIYRVGDHINKMKNQFPIAYKDWEKDKSNGFYITISSRKILSDANVYITSNNKGFITSIWIGNNNS